MSNFHLLLLFPCLLCTAVGKPLMPEMTLMDMGGDYFDENVDNFLATEFDVRRVRRDQEDVEDEGDQPLSRVPRQAVQDFAEFPPPDQQTAYDCPETRSSAGAFPWPAYADAVPLPTYAGPQSRTIGGLAGFGQGIGQNVGIGQSAGPGPAHDVGIGLGGESIASPVVKGPVVYVTTIPYIAGYKMTPIISEKHVIVKDARSGGGRDAEPSVEMWSTPPAARSSDFRIDDAPPHPLDLNVFFTGRTAGGNPDAGNPYAENPDAGNPYVENPYAGNTYARDTDEELLDVPYPEAIGLLQQRIQHLQSLQLARERLNRSDHENCIENY